MILNRGVGSKRGFRQQKILMKKHLWLSWILLEFSEYGVVGTNPAKENFFVLRRNWIFTILGGTLSFKNSFKKFFQIKDPDQPPFPIFNEVKLNFSTKFNLIKAPFDFIEKPFRHVVLGGAFDKLHNGFFLIF